MNGRTAHGKNNSLHLVAELTLNNIKVINIYLLFFRKLPTSALSEITRKSFPKEENVAIRTI